MLMIYNIGMKKFLEALGITSHQHNWMPVSPANSAETTGQMGICVVCRIKGRIY